MIGEALPRREDRRLLTGGGRFAGDAGRGAASLAVVRSPHPHARVEAVDLDAVTAMPGVLGAWDAASLPLAERFLADPEVPGLAAHPRPVLAGPEARYTGEAVAVVVAETAAQAADAAQALPVAYEPLPGCGRPSQGPSIGTARLGYGDVEAGLAGASARVRRSYSAGRVTAAPMEPRTVLAEPSADGLLVRSSTQWTQGVRDQVCRSLGLPAEVVAVVAGDVGGAFGGKGFAYPEEVLVAAAARLLGRPVRWTASRSEETLSSCQGHGIEFEVEAGAGPDGRLLAVRARFLHNVGAYTAALTAQAENLAGHMLSLYRLPALQVDVDYRLTNSPPTRFIRGGGRPIGNFAIERTVDALAGELGLDRLEMRRRNVLSGADLPFQTELSLGGAPEVLEGAPYDEMLEAVAGALGAPAGAGEGAGIACGIESSGIGRPSLAAMTLARDGTVTVSLPATPQGQGHETTFAQVAAARLGFPVDRVAVRAGDSRLVPGLLTAASRSAIEVGNSVAVAARALVRRAAEAAAEAIEAAPEDVEVLPEGARVRGTTAVRAWEELLPPEGVSVLESFQGLRARAWGPTVHGARVRVDAETGSVQLLEHVVAHDGGPPINPAVVEGQLQGGFAHGAGYALFEELPYGEDGAPAGSNFLDYLLVGPPELPLEPRLLHFESASSQNEEGFRGVGEAGTIPAPAAILAAVEDALRRQGRRVELTGLPLKPEDLAAAAASVDAAAAHEPYSA